MTDVSGATFGFPASARSRKTSLSVNPPSMD
ncbi:uncharacterized protein METZ01_LOCUS498679 [marine metagenome]|uniref:Uncharacterized protein n=1 Tax=marine metagenome TaxID=408172 RepID=A0A383DNK5_9ZZZZ